MEQQWPCTVEKSDNDVIFPLTNIEHGKNKSHNSLSLTFFARLLLWVLIGNKAKYNDYWVFEVLWKSFPVLNVFLHLIASLCCRLTRKPNPTVQLIDRIFRGRFLLLFLRSVLASSSIPVVRTFRWEPFRWQCTSGHITEAKKKRTTRRKQNCCIRVDLTICF